MPFGNHHEEGEFIRDCSVVNHVLALLNSEIDAYDKAVGSLSNDRIDGAKAALNTVKYLVYSKYASLLLEQHYRANPSRRPEPLTFEQWKAAWQTSMSSLSETDKLVAKYIGSKGGYSLAVGEFSIQSGPKVTPK